MFKGLFSSLQKIGKALMLPVAAAGGRPPAWPGRHRLSGMCRRWFWP